MRDYSKMADVDGLCKKVRTGELTFDEAVDYMMSQTPPDGPARIDRISFLWKSLGKPTDEELAQMAQQRGRPSS